VDEGEEVEAERGCETAEQGPREEKGVRVTLVVGRQVVIIQHTNPAEKTNEKYAR
jgi:hypothetical protein